MNNIQINGQRRWGPPENWTGPPPAHGTEIFVKNLPEHVFELELYATFSCVGIVYEVRLPVNWDGLNRGYAFVRFTTVREADDAIETFDGYEIRRNRKIKVTRSVDNTRLFLSAVPTEKNANDLERDLSNYVENVKKVYVYPTLENRFLYRGYAFVEFETHRDAAIAKRILTPDVCYSIFEKKCIAAWANPLPFLDRFQLKSLNVLFMRNIPKDIKSFHLKKAIERLIGGEEIKKVKKMNNFAFLTFTSHKSAERALHILQSIPFLICDHETQVEWAIPREMFSSPFVGGEKEEYQGLEANRNGCGGSSSEGMRGLRFGSYSQLAVNAQKFSESPDSMLSTQNDIMRSRIYVDDARMYRGESYSTMLSQNRQKGGGCKIVPLNEILPTLASSHSSNGNSWQNLCLDLTNSGNPFESMRKRDSVDTELLGGSFDGGFPVSSRSVAYEDSMEMCSPFRRNSSTDNFFWSEDGFFDKIPSPYSPLPSSAKTSHSSESSFHSPFLFGERDIFPSNMFEEIFLKKDIFTHSKYNCDSPEIDRFENFKEESLL